MAVERGDQRGRRLGFPTANVLDVDTVPLDGVYAGTVQIDPESRGPTFVAAVSVGHRPWPPTLWGFHTAGSWRAAP
ncbi:riboflavin kinase [Nocardioides houyundeii]|uniref:riboflavin kinase n=1 Tax=Nocardioides houyundeii TaxID=2045452 RepID=UPI000DF42A93